MWIGNGSRRPKMIGRRVRAAGTAVLAGWLLGFDPTGFAAEIDDGGLAMVSNSSAGATPIVADLDAAFDFPYVGVALAPPPVRSHEQTVSVAPVVHVPLRTPAPTRIDSTPPQAQLWILHAARRSKGTEWVRISTLDDDSQIEGALLVDGVIVASFSAASFNYELDTAHLADGPHVLLAKVEDSSGNLGVSAPVTVKVRNGDTAPPSVYVAYPASGTNVYSDHVVNITASASDNDAVSRVDFYVDATRVCSITSPPFTCPWQVPDGDSALQYRIRVQAFDSMENASSSSVTVFPPSASSRIAANPIVAGPKL